MRFDFDRLGRRFGERMRRREERREQREDSRESALERRARRHRRHRLADHLAHGLRLSDLRPGERGRVLGIGGGEHFRVRLMEMGLTPGEIVEVDKYAPLQDPMELIIRRYHLSLRLYDAAKIAVERV